DSNGFKRLRYPAGNKKLIEVSIESGGKIWKTYNIENYTSQFPCNLTSKLFIVTNPTKYDLHVYVRFYNDEEKKLSEFIFNSGETKQIDLTGNDFEMVELCMTGSNITFRQIYEANFNYIQPFIVAPQSSSRKNDVFVVIANPGLSLGWRSDP